MVGRFHRSLVQQQSGAGAPGAAFQAFYGTTVDLPAAGGTCFAPVDSLAGSQLILIVFGSSVNTPINAITGWTLRDTEAFVSSGWCSLFTRTAAGDGAANNVTIPAVTSSNRIIAQMIAVNNAIAVNEFLLGYSNKATFAMLGTSLTFPLATHTAGHLVVFSGAVLSTDQPSSVYSRGTEAVDYFTASGNDYNLTAGGGTTDGSALDPFTITNASSGTHCFGGYVTVS